MRRQYHSRLVGERTLTWDVHRLIDLSRGLPVREVTLSSIAELDECFWFDREEPTCRSVALHARLISEADTRHPIILSAEGRVMDGMHRVCKALLDKQSTVPAVQFEVDPEPDHINANVDQLPYTDP